MLFGELQRLGVAATVGVCPRLENDRSAANLDDGERVKVTMWINANHEVQLICKHPERPPASWGITPVPVWGVEPRAAGL